MPTMARLVSLSGRGKLTYRVFLFFLPTTYDAAAEYLSVRRVYKSPSNGCFLFCFSFWGDFFFLNNFLSPAGLSLRQVESRHPERKVDEESLVQGAGGGLVEQVCICAVPAGELFGLPSVLRWSCALGVVVIETSWWLFILPRNTAFCSCGLQSLEAVADRVVRPRPRPYSPRQKNVFVSMSSGNRLAYST